MTGTATYRLHYAGAGRDGGSGGCAGATSSSSGSTQGVLPPHCMSMSPTTSSSSGSPDVASECPSSSDVNHALPTGSTTLSCRVTCSAITTSSQWGDDMEYLGLDPPLPCMACPTIKPLLLFERGATGTCAAFIVQPFGSRQPHINEVLWWTWSRMCLRGREQAARISHDGRRRRG